MSASPKTNSATRKLPTSIPPKGLTTVQNVAISSPVQQDVRLCEIPLNQATGAESLNPRGNRVLIRRIEEESGIALTDKPKSIKGIVLAVGPGKWHPGEWWKTRRLFAKGGTELYGPLIGASDLYLIDWEWIPGWREPMSVKAGDLVLFNSRWNDLAHAENVGTGADGKGPLERPLSYKLDPLTHLVTEDDIFCILSEDVQASYVGTAIEAQYFKNTTTAEECFTTRVGPR